MNLLIFAVLMICPERGNSSNTVFWLLVIFWGANGFLQAMGWSPMVRVMSHCFPSEDRGKVMGFLGTCYQFGAAFSWFPAFLTIGYYAENGNGD